MVRFILRFFVCLFIYIVRLCIYCSSQFVLRMFSVHAEKDADFYMLILYCDS